MELCIETLSKHYARGKIALDGVNLTLSNGMFGLLGPNGAGKTTLMKILATLLEPSSGSVRYDELTLGRDDQQIRAQLGYLPQEYGLYSTLTAVEQLNYFATLHNRRLDWVKRIDQVLEMVNLQHVRRQRVGGFSGGMKQRLGIAQALLNDPGLLIVDEPTAGLDPSERVRFRNLLGQLSADRIVILSTHIVDDISSSCNDMALLSAGKILYSGEPARFIESARGNVWTVLALPDAVPAIERDFRVIHSVRRADGVNLRILASPELAANLPNREPGVPTLEDAYIWQTEVKSTEAAHA